MQIGLFNLMTHRDRSKPQQEVLAETIEQIRVAEELGFNAAWFAEHHFSNYCICPSPIAMAIHLAGLTKTIRLGTAVIVAPLYHPLRMLEELAMLDTLSNGRAILGFGSGYQQYEFHKFGVDLKRGRDIFLETLDVLEQFLDAGRVEYAGQCLTVPATDFSLRMVQKGPSIYVAGLVADHETQRRIMQRGYIPFVNTGWNTLEVIKAARDKIAAGYAAAGGNPEESPYAYQRYVFVTDSQDEALQAAEGARYIRRIALAMRNRYQELEGSFLKEIPAPDEPPLEVLVDRMVIGPPGKCIERLVADIEALKPTHLSCFMNLPGVGHKRILKSMERFATEVVPAVSRHFGGLEAAGTMEPEVRRAPAQSARIASAAG